MKRFPTLFLLLIISQVNYANSAMPGVWEAGANGRFLPLFVQDSIYFGKIQMQHEQILVNLYPGFAIVKGEYWMYNTTVGKISMHVAYPKQGRFEASIVKNVVPSYISGLRVQVNDQPVSLLQSTDSAAQQLQESKSFFQDNNSSTWFLWQMDFAPKSITKITVYFITNNSDADVVKGYSHRKGDAFTYVLESGRAWGGAIDSGTVCIHLKGGLAQKDITGVLPDSTLTFNNDQLMYSFTNKEPMPKDNLLLFYKDSPENFNFINDVLPKTEAYFKEIDTFEINAFSKENMQLVHKLDILPDTNGISSISWLFIGIGIGVLSIIGFIVWLIKKGGQSATARRH